MILVSRFWEVSPCHPLGLTSEVKTMKGQAQVQHVCLVLVCLFLFFWLGSAASALKTCFSWFAVVHC